MGCPCCEPCNGPCDTAADCSHGCRCVNGECVAPCSGACATSADCAEGCVCLDGQCVMGCGGACETSSDCANGCFCVESQCNELCVTISGGAGENSLSPSVCCDRFTTEAQTVTVPAELTLPCRIRITGAVDDDLLIDGSIIEDGLYPTGPWHFCDPQPTCNGAHLIGSAGSGKWVMEISNRTFDVSCKNNIYGGASYALTICFGVKDALSDGNPFP